MMTGQLGNLYIVGLSLVVLILLGVAWFLRAQDPRPLAKIRVRADDRVRRALPPPEDENNIGQPLDLRTVLFLAILLVATAALISRI
jgi:hypothetical protein